MPFLNALTADDNSEVNQGQGGGNNNRKPSQNVRNPQNQKVREPAVGSKN